MSITEVQREERRKHLGSSDMAAVMGLDSWSNAYDIWLEKTGKLEAEKDKAIFRRGVYMEAALLAFAGDELGDLMVEPDRLEFIKPNLHLCAHPDAMSIAVPQAPEPVEAKSLGWYAPDSWGEPGTDQLPDRTLIQAHCHMICTDTDFCHVPVYLPRREFQMYGVSFDTEIGQSICDAAVRFWESHVIKDTPPENVTPSMAVLKRIRRIPDVTPFLTDGLSERLTTAKEAAKLTKTIVDEIQAEILKEIGQAEGGICDGGLFTYFEQTRKEYLSPETTFRVLRFKKGKTNGK